MSLLTVHVTDDHENTLWEESTLVEELHEPLMAVGFHEWRSRPEAHALFVNRGLVSVKGIEDGLAWLERAREHAEPMDSLPCPDLLLEELHHGR